jgi:hypothetical protein
MKLNGSENRRTVALAAYRDKHFLGYAVKGREGWIAVGALGMSWSKWKCATLIDAQTWLRTTSHSAKFEWYSEISDLAKVIEKLPPYDQPGITLESLGDGILMPMKLGQSAYVQFGRLG